VVKSRNINWAGGPLGHHAGLTLAADSAYQPCVSLDAYTITVDFRTVAEGLIETLNY
jgi:hypothetical protein